MQRANRGAAAHGRVGGKALPALDGGCMPARNDSAQPACSGWPDRTVIQGAVITAVLSLSSGNPATPWGRRLCVPPLPTVCPCRRQQAPENWSRRLLEFPLMIFNRRSTIKASARASPQVSRKRIQGACAVASRPCRWMFQRQSVPRRQSSDRLSSGGGISPCEPGSTSHNPRWERCASGMRDCHLASAAPCRCLQTCRPMRWLRLADAPIDYSG
ncbi:hypothetical protein HNP60_000396 [Sphingobium sp. B1D3A]|uniref:Uncharacterized protein n=1 Tax=Sphingobium lignivorans TaxID=2735886 RepID=A0ABR6NAX7_9SPHN|nr:hypothetical protein [Sphingobium lignivorans]